MTTQVGERLGQLVITVLTRLLSHRICGRRVPRPLLRRFRVTPTVIEVRASQARLESVFTVSRRIMYVRLVTLSLTCKLNFCWKLTLKTWARATVESVFTVSRRIMYVRLVTLSLTCKLNFWSWWPPHPLVSNCQGPPTIERSSRTYNL